MQNKENSKKNEANAKENLANLNLKLPEVSTPGGSYVSVNVRSNIAYIAIQFPILNGEYLYQGRLYF